MVVASPRAQHAVRRLVVMQAVLLGLLGVLLCGAFQLQILSGGRFREKSERNRIRLLEHRAPRGEISDHRGTILVGNRPVLNVIALPQELAKPDEAFAHVAKELGETPEALKRTFQRRYLAPFAPVVLASDVPLQHAFALAESTPELPGIIIEPAFAREYPFDEVVAHVLGYLGLISRQEHARLREYGFRTEDLVGRGGVEGAYDAYLRGQRGGVQVEVDHLGRQVRRLGERLWQPGKTVQLTVDVGLQQLAHDLLEGYRGSVAVLDCDRGAILALESAPTFDPNDFVLPQDTQRVVESLRHPQAPLVNRAVSSAYPLGSIFKIVVAAAALQSDVVTPQTGVMCRGGFRVGDRTFHCWRREGHGYVTLRRALSESCNVYFYDVGLKVGAEALAQTARAFGLGETSGITLAGEVSGLVPSPGWKIRALGERWYAGETANLAIGQGYLQVTPLQVARLMSAVANGGNLLRPYLVERIGGVEVQSSSRYPIAGMHDVMVPIRHALRQSVLDPAGTAHRVHVPGRNLAAKTSTAQVGDGRTHAWFAGFAPASQPRIALVVLLEYGGSGGEEAAEIAAALVDYCRQQQWFVEGDASDG